MSHVIGRGRYARSTYPHASIKGIATGYAAPVDTIARASASRLVGLAATSAPNGTSVFVRSVRDWFVLDKTSALTADNITVADAIGGGQWLRKYTPSVKWQQRAAWAIDPAAADDEGVGSGADPLKTHAELARRFLGHGLTLPQDTTVTIVASLPVTDLVSIDVKFASSTVLLRYVGTPTTVRTGTLSGVTALVAGTTLTAIVDGVGGAFAVSNRVRMTAGASVGFIGWVVRAADGACNPFTTIDTTTTPVGGAPTMGNPTTDTFVVETLPTVGLGKISQSNALGVTVVLTQQIIFEDLDVSDSANPQFAVLDPSALFAHCKLDTANFSDSTATVSGCLLTGSAFVLNSTILYWANAFTGPATSVSFVSCSVLLFNENVAMGGPSFGLSSTDSFLQLQASASFESLSVHDATGVGVRVERSTQLDAATVLWGSGNTSFGIDAGGRFFYAVADKPTITGGGATDTKVGGVNKDYAGIPFFNVANGAAIVESE